MAYWKITDKGEDLGSNLLLNLASFGAYSALGLEEKIYEIENSSTGETRFVIASDDFEIGDTISENDWIKEA